MKSTKKSRDYSKKFTKEYKKLMLSSPNPFIPKKEWNEYGDQIEKFSIYENYTPVKTTSGTNF